MNSAGISRVFLSAMLLGASIHPAIAESILLQPVADTTLVEITPDNNMGGTSFVNAGRAGQSGLRNRGLFKFDFSSIPLNSKIKSASVTLEVTQEPNAGGESSSFTLHRLLKNWGEGDKDSTFSDSPGFGLSATDNEATWNSPFAFTTNTWSFPGASNDFTTVISSSATVYGVADFPRFDSTAQMIADVQTWLDNPELNFGWLLKSESESTLRTARRFGSREFAAGDVFSPPYIEVEFVSSPVLSNPQITNGQFNFSFFSEPNQNYVVEFKNALASTNSWLTLTNINAFESPTNILIVDTISTNARFYRVVAP